MNTFLKVALSDVYFYCIAKHSVIDNNNIVSVVRITSAILTTQFEPMVHLQ